MTSALLKCESFVPPLLEKQISPPYKIVARHVDYLQKWREYLLCVWVNDLDKDVDRVCVQQSVDELISTILLIDFIEQSYPMAIPSLEEILKIVNKPTAFSLCDVVYNQVSCTLLKAVFNPDRLSGPMIEPPKDVELSSLTNISEAAGFLYGSRMPITLLGDFYQLCLDRPVADKRIHKKGSDRRNKVVYYTPAALVDYIVYHTLKKAFYKLEPEQIQRLQILDPSCGCGVFLIASIRFILEWFKDKYSNKKSPYLSPQESFELLESMIYGTDIDERAIHWTRRLLLLTVWDFYINNGVTKNDIRNLRVPTLEKNIVCSDFPVERKLSKSLKGCLLQHKSVSEG